MCSTKRPLDQYVTLNEIRNQRFRSAVTNEANSKATAMNLNANSITASATKPLTAEEEEEAARLLLEQDDGVEWNDEDFVDEEDEEDWGDDGDGDNDEELGDNMKNFLFLVLWFSTHENLNAPRDLSFALSKEI